MTIPAPTDVEAVPGTALERHADATPQSGVDIYAHLTPAQYRERRQALLRFIKTQLVEAEYGDRGRIVRINDYYKVPGTNRLALSKKGAESIGDHYRYKVAYASTVDSVLQVDFVMVRSAMTLHRSNVIVGASEAAATSAEASFQKAKRKYLVGGKVDWRAAYNDVLSRAQKRAYVKALIVACAASDILEVAGETEIQDLEEGRDYEVVGQDAPGQPLPLGIDQARVKALFDILTDFPDLFTKDEYAAAARWVNSDRCTAEKLEEQIQRAEQRVRRQEEMDLLRPEDRPPLAREGEDAR